MAHFWTEPSFLHTLTPPSPLHRSPTDDVDNDDGVDSFLPPFANSENKALDAEIRVRTALAPNVPPSSLLRSPFCFDPDNLFLEDVVFHFAKLCETPGTHP
jgi:hypothetical protein